MTDHAAREARALSAAQDKIRQLRARHLAWTRNSGMSALLALLVVAIFILPAAAGEEFEWRLTTDIMVTLILVSGVVAVVEHRRFVTLLVVVTILVIAARWVEWIVPAGATPNLRDLATIVAIVVLSAGVGINVFAPSRALSDRIFGAIVLYLLLALIWAVVYALIGASVPDAFAGRASADMGLLKWGYFSMVTLTTVGYGDITPVAPLARSLAALEALTGQLYPAIIIARLVSLRD